MHHISKDGRVHIGCVIWIDVNNLFACQLLKECQFNGAPSFKRMSSTQAVDIHPNHKTYANPSVPGHVMYPRQYTTLSLPSGLTSYFELPPPPHHQARFYDDLRMWRGRTICIKKSGDPSEKPLLKPLTFFLTQSQILAATEWAALSLITYPSPPSLSALFPASRFKCFCMKDAPLQRISHPQLDWCLTLTPLRVDTSLDFNKVQNRMEIPYWNITVFIWYIVTTAEPGKNSHNIQLITNK